MGQQVDSAVAVDGNEVQVDGAADGVIAVVVFVDNMTFEVDTAGRVPLDAETEMDAEHQPVVEVAVASAVVAYSAALATFAAHQQGRGSSLALVLAGLRTEGAGKDAVADMEMVSQAVAPVEDVVLLALSLEAEAL